MRLAEQYFRAPACVFSDHRQQFVVATLVCAFLLASRPVANFDALESLNLQVNAPLEPGDPPLPSGSGGDGGGGNGAGKKAIVAGTGAAGLGALFKVLNSGEREAPAVARLGETGAMEARGFSTAEHFGGAAADDSFLAARSARAAAGDTSLSLGAFGATVGGDVAEKSSYLARIGPAIYDTPVTANLTNSDIEMKWLFRPDFRAEVLAELAEREPAAMASFAEGEGAAATTLRPFEQLYNAADPLIPEKDAISVVVEDVKLEGPGPDTTGQTLGQTENGFGGPDGTTNDEFNERVKAVLKEVVDGLPEGKVKPTNSQLRAALTKALKPESKWHYELNAQTGKLSMKYKLDRGEISAEPNIYLLARRVIYLTAIGTGIKSKVDLVNLAQKYFAKTTPPGKPTHVEPAHA